MLDTNSPSFTALPIDVLLAIFLEVAVPDILSLKQTCRVLHDLGSSDYLWHQISKFSAIPLDLPRDVDPQGLSCIELQPAIVKAFKLDDNWSRRTPRVTKCSPIRSYGNNVNAVVDEMQLLSAGRWLMTSQRSFRLEYTRATIDLWCLKDADDVYCAASFDIFARYKKFAVSLTRDEKFATLAITIDNATHGVLQIYDIPLIDRSEAEFLHNSTPRMKKVIPRPSRARGTIHEVSIHDKVIATTFVDLSTESLGHSYQVLLVNTNTWSQVLLHPKFDEPFTRLSIKLCHDRILFIGSFHDNILVRTFYLPSCMVHQQLAGRSSVWDPLNRDDSSIVEDMGDYEEFLISHMPNVQDFCVSESDSSSDTTPSLPKSLSFLFYAAALGDSEGKGVLVRLFLDPDHQGQYSLMQREVFGAPRDSSVKLVRIGVTGRRAVWIEQNWETDGFRVIKAHFPDENVDWSTVNVLIPPYPSLPFSPQMCNSLAFDETTGRLCVGVATGDLWMLDFS